MKIKKRKIRAYENKPDFVQTMLAFKPINDVLDVLMTGFVDCTTKGGHPVFRCLENEETYLIVPAMQGWIDTIRRVLEHYRLNDPVNGIDIRKIQVLCNRLDASMPFEQKDVIECREIVKKLMAAYRKMDIDTVKSLVRTQTIQFEFEQKGLVNA